MEKLVRKGDMIEEAGVIYLMNDTGGKYATHPLICSFWRICDGFTNFKDIVKSVRTQNEKVHMEYGQLSQLLGRSIFDLRSKGLML